MIFHLLAPGPSMSQAIADSLRGHNVGAIGNCFELAPWAYFLASTDRKWWMKYPQAFEFAGRKFSADKTTGVEFLPVGTHMNSGVLALNVAMLLGATEVYLHGFDMHGTHYFGPYSNGLRNTSDSQRVAHMRQYREFAARSQIKVFNATQGSALDCFPKVAQQEFA